MLPRGYAREYLSYVVPSVLAFVLNGVYSIIDGLFVGRVVGDAGLAGINVAWPLVALMMSAGTGIGMGGAVISSICAGQGDSRGAKRMIAHTITLLVLATPLIMAVLFALGGPLLYLMGGRGPILAQSQLYLEVIAWGSLFQLLSSGFIPLIRNKGKVTLAFAVVAAAGVLNVCLDFLTVVVLGWGVQGAALATVVSQALVFACGAVFFLLKENRPLLADFAPSLRIARRTLKVAVSPFALTLLPEVTTVVLNIATEAHGGATAQAAFAVISYVGVSVQWVIQGINDGSQPLLSKRFGEGKFGQVKLLRRTNCLLAGAFGLVSIGVLFALRASLAELFGLSDASTEAFLRGMALFSLVFPFYALTHAFTSYFYGIECNGMAISLVVGEVVLLSLFAVVLPLAGGLDGVWLSVFAEQFVLVWVGLALVLRTPLERIGACNMPSPSSKAS